MRGQESVKFSNISATSAPVGSLTPTNTTFPLEGGYYQVDTVATTYGSCQLQGMGPDGATFLNHGAAITTNGFVQLYLAPGQYQLTVSGATALYASITRIPIE
jgi:hypothetical protein